MTLREFLSENFAGDLEYHPRRAAIYLVLGAAVGSVWFISTPAAKFTSISLVFALGTLTLVTKGIFLLRKSSEGWGLTETELAQLSSPENRKPLPALPSQAAQILQDFGAGSLLLWPLLNLAKDFDSSWTDPPRFHVFCIGAVLFLLGWSIRRFSS
jgi:hypothetical protein